MSEEKKILDENELDENQLDEISGGLGKQKIDTSILDQPVIGDRVNLSGPAYYA